MSLFFERDRYSLLFCLSRCRKLNVDVGKSCWDSRTVPVNLRKIGQKRRQVRLNLRITMTKNSVRLVQVRSTVKQRQIQRFVSVFFVVRVSLV
jgi:hypothetical protein